MTKTDRETVEALIKDDLTDMYISVGLPLTLDDAATIKATVDTLRALSTENERLKVENGQLIDELHSAALTKIDAYRIIKASGARSHGAIAKAFDDHFAPVRAALEDTTQ